MQKEKNIILFAVSSDSPTKAMNQECEKTLLQVKIQHSKVYLSRRTEVLSENILEVLRCVKMYSFCPVSVI